MESAPLKLGKKITAGRKVKHDKQKKTRPPPKLKVCIHHWTVELTWCLELITFKGFTFNWHQCIE